MLVSRFSESTKQHLPLTRPSDLEPFAWKLRMSEDRSLPLPVEPSWRGPTSALPLTSPNTVDQPLASTLQRSEHAKQSSAPRPKAPESPSNTGFHDEWRHNTQFAGNYGSSASQVGFGDQSNQSRSPADDSVDEDEGVVDGEDAEDDEASRRQTVAERLAARRKMRRFRLTHQQTRFLMSEFAKQPHPDAAHRERLSREIPGLSPRQVQVWFQNRRAKIKRLTVDDRDRVIRMRAVPEGFDNVRALHSPYGAVHGVGGSMSPVSALGPGQLTQPFGSQEISRHLLDDSRRSTAGHPYALGGIDLSVAQSMGVVSALSSPMGALHVDRYTSSNTSTPPRSAPTYWNSGHNNVRDSMSQLARSSLPQTPSTGPMPRDWETGLPSDTSQSPMQPGSVWRSGSYDLVSQPGDSSSLVAERKGDYSAGDVSPALGGSLNATGSYARPSGMPESMEKRLRARSSSSTSLPLTIDFGFRDAYRTVGMGPSSAQFLDRSRIGLPERPGATLSPRGAYLHAPLSAPLDMSPTRGARSQPGPSETNEYPTSQLMAPIPAPRDFGRQFSDTASGAATPGDGNSSGPLKDLFGHGVL